MQKQRKRLHWGIIRVNIIEVGALLAGEETLLLWWLIVCFSQSQQKADYLVILQMLLSWISSGFHHRGTTEK